MEGIEMECPATPSYGVVDSDDFCDSILSTFSASQNDDHQHLCAVIGTISQEIKDRNQPLTPIAYFGAVWAALDRHSSGSDPSPLVSKSLTTILSLLLPRVPAAVLKKNREALSDTLIRVLRTNSGDSDIAAAGLICVVRLLIIRDSANWNDVSNLYEFLLGFISSSDVKVKKQAHKGIRDVLQSFQGTPVLAPASEAITKTLEKALLLAGGSNADGDEAPRGARVVLYILDALKVCLPFMSMKYATAVLNFYKKLLQLRQPSVSERIISSLSSICIYPTSEVSAEVLVDLLCSLADSSSRNGGSAVFVTSTARLLDVGMRKVYSLNRQICVVKLPIIIIVLKEILASEHREPIFASTEALKSLINNCIDEGLIKQGVDQIMLNKNVDSRKSGPTVIEKVCASIESLLHPCYIAVSDRVFQVISVMFDKLGKYSSYFMRGTLKKMADMQRLPDDDFPFRRQLHECLGSAVSAMGPETFLGILPLNLEADNLSEANVWLLPIVKQYTVGAHLSFFTETVLGMISVMKQKSHKLEQEGMSRAAGDVNGLVYSLWSLLPSFCNYPVDTAESFKDLEKVLSGALSEQPYIRGVICSALQKLIQQNKKVLEEQDSLSASEVGSAMERAMACYTPQVAVDNLNAIKASAHEFLTVMSGILCDTLEDDGGCLRTTVMEFASIADKKLMSRIFKKILSKLLKVTKEDTRQESARHFTKMQIDTTPEKSPSLKRALMLDLGVSFLPGLDDEEIATLLTTVKPALQDDNGLVQKKAYRVLSLIMQNCDGFLLSSLDELLQLMIDVLPSCHFSAKKHRLDCLYFLILHVSKKSYEQRGREILSSFLTEIILALKEANSKARDRAYDLLVEIGHAYGDEENGGKKENLHQFFHMVAGGLAGETPHMISAATRGLARLAYEFSDLVSTAYEYLPSTFLMLQRKNREIIKANLGLLKVLVAKSQAEGLQMHLKSMVEGLLKWQDDTKNHFKSKVKHLVEMLVRRCGLDAVKAVMPEEHMKLLTNIRKIKERKDRKRAANPEETRSHLSKATTSRLSRWNHTKLFSDYGDQETEDSDAECMNEKPILGRRRKASSVSKASLSWTKRMRPSDKMLTEDMLEENDGEPLDLTNESKTRSALRSSMHSKRKEESDDELEIDSEGRLIVPEEGKEKKRKPSDPDSDARSEAGSHLSVNSSRKTKKKRHETSHSGKAHGGSEYASKKAGGDVKKKNRFEPYAYYTLDRKMLSHRSKHQIMAKKAMTSVLKRYEGKSGSSLMSKRLTRTRDKQKKFSKSK